MRNAAAAAVNVYREESNTTKKKNEKKKTNNSNAMDHKLSPTITARNKFNNLPLFAS